MTLSFSDLFKIGIGPSSSHTVGPMVAARRFSLELAGLPDPTGVRTVRVDLFGSLGATGAGHGSLGALLAGLQGEVPESVDPGLVRAAVERVRATGRLRLLNGHEIALDPDSDLVLHPRQTLPFHPNGLLFTAESDSGEQLLAREYFSVGGGFVVEPSSPETSAVADWPYPFRTGDELLAQCRSSGLRVSDLMLANELSRASEADVREGLLRIWQAMSDSIDAGCSTTGMLPGGLGVARRAAEFRLLLESVKEADPMSAVDWVNLYALAVNEENAAGGRVVTAPTNGAAGIIPAVLRYHLDFVTGHDEDLIVRFLLAATAIGGIYKECASISGAEVGCQGEVGAACSMAAAALAEVMGGSPSQVENAAEIAMEHNLGLTCDPVGGLVQVPCIERNAIAAVKAINAARLALRGDGTHLVSLDNVVKTMLQTGLDMKVKYKETSRGGLAVNVVEC